MFAPVDTAFAKIDAATMTTLTTDAPLLSGILTYHVVPGKLSPTEVVGTHPTANGAHPYRHRFRRQPDGQRGERDLRRGADQERDRLPDRHRAHAAGQLTEHPRGRSQVC